MHAKDTIFRGGPKDKTRQMKAVSCVIPGPKCFNIKHTNQMLIQLDVAFFVPSSITYYLFIFVGRGWGCGGGTVWIFVGLPGGGALDICKPQSDCAAAVNTDFYIHIFILG